MNPVGVSHTNAFPSITKNSWERNTDKIGVIASIICAIHCIATPFLLLVTPAFGSIWSHPSTHFVMALIVIPIAALMMAKGYKRHRIKWILGIGSAGILFVVGGTVAPVVKSTLLDENSAYFISGDQGTDATTDKIAIDQCENSCCPTLESTAGGGFSLKFPIASILTTIGGILLIVTHLTNLCSTCPSCSRETGTCKASVHLIPKDTPSQGIPEATFSK